MPKAEKKCTLSMVPGLLVAARMATPSNDSRPSISVSNAERTPFVPLLELDQSKQNRAFRKKP